MPDRECLPGILFVHHLICGGYGTSMKVLTTGANVPDISKAVDLLDAVPPVAGRVGRPRRRLVALGLPWSVLVHMAMDNVDKHNEILGEPRELIYLGSALVNLVIHIAWVRVRRRGAVNRQRTDPL